MKLIVIVLLLAGCSTMTAEQSADRKGLEQMGKDAGLSGAKLDEFVASGGTKGSTGNK